MKRWLVHILAALSLLLFCLICILWIRSYWYSDNLTWIRTDGQRSLHTREGHLVFNQLRADWSYRPHDIFGIRYSRDTAFSAATAMRVRVYSYPDTRDKTVDWEHFGFEWYRRIRFDGVVYITAGAPFWSLALVTSLLPLTWIISRLRALRRPKVGACPDCGYDMRATPDRCPECGAMPYRKT